MLVSAAGLALRGTGFEGKKPGEGRALAGIRLRWCPPGKFTMGSPPGEPERRPGEEQVEVKLTRGFWAGKFEVTQGDELGSDVAMTTRHRSRRQKRDIGTLHRFRLFIETLIGTWITSARSARIPPSG